MLPKYNEEKGHGVICSMITRFLVRVRVLVLQKRVVCLLIKGLCMALMVCVLLLLVLFNVVTPAGYKNIAKLSDFSYVLNKELLHLSLSSECNTKVMKPEGYKIPALDGDAVADSRDVGGGAGGHGAEVFPRSANVPQEVEEKLTYLPFDPERLIPFKVRGGEGREERSDDRILHSTIFNNLPLFTSLIAG